MQLRAVGRRCSTGAATVLGDIAQGTTPWATADWAQTLTHLGKPARARRGARPRLPGAGRGHRLRQPPAARHRPRGRAPRCRCARTRACSTSCPAPTSRRRSCGRRRGARRAGSVGVIVADADVERDRPPAPRTGPARVLGDDGPAERVTLVAGRRWPRAWSSTTSWWSSRPPSSTASRLRPAGLRRLYVVLTRAVSGLTVVHARPLPDELAAGVPRETSAGGMAASGRRRRGARRRRRAGADAAGSLGRAAPPLPRPGPPRRRAATTSTCSPARRATSTSYGWPRGSTTPSTTRRRRTTRSAAPGSRRVVARAARRGQHRRRGRPAGPPHRRPRRRSRATSTAAVLCDADLAILASEARALPGVRRGGPRRVRARRRPRLRCGRAAVLRGLLARAALFSTAHGRDRWEARRPRQRDRRAGPARRGVPRSVTAVPRRGGWHARLGVHRRLVADQRHAAPPRAGRARPAPARQATGTSASSTADGDRRCRLSRPMLRSRKRRHGRAGRAATPPYSATSGMPVNGSVRLWCSVSATYSMTFFRPSARSTMPATIGKCR